MSEKDGLMLAIECVNRHNHGFIKCHPMFIRGHNEAVKAITKELQSLIETAPIGGDYFEGFSEGIKVGRNEMIEDASAKALKAERDADRAHRVLAAELHAAAMSTQRDIAIRERDALLTRLSPADDEALVEIAVKAISKQVPDQGVQWGDIRDAAIDAIAAIRPHIEAAERERCAKAVEKVAEKINVAHHERPEWEDGYLQGVYDAAAAIRSGK